MSTAGNKSYDAIIIGAGISGLICASFLSKAGMKVSVVEQHSKPGGYCSSFKRKGFSFDAAAHSLGGYRKNGGVRKILTYLGIDKHIQINRYDPSDIITTPDFKISFYNNVDDTVSHLIRIFPREDNNIVRFFKFLTSENMSAFAKLKDQSFSSLLESFFLDKQLISALSLPVLGNGGLPPSLMHAFTGSKIFVEFLIDGGYYPEGGMQVLPDVLENFIRQNKGDIVYGRAVRKILCENNIAIGVKLINNEIFKSKYVIAACDITQTFNKLLERNLVSERILHKLKIMVPSLSTFILYIGLRKPFRGLPASGTNVWYLPFYDLEKIYTYIKQTNYDKVGGYMIRLSPDKKSLLAFINAPFKSHSFWKKNKKQFASDFLSRVEMYLPDIKKNIAYFDAATPSTLQKYTFNHRGAAYGWAPTLTQLFDPDLRQKSSIEGLYFTGHWVTQAHGLPGVIYLGYKTADLILKKESRADKYTYLRRDN